MKYLLLSFMLFGNAIAGTLTICHDTNFALCESSVGHPTGKMITVMSNEGKKMQYPEVAVNCPIVRGDAIAYLGTGTMGNSCISKDKNVVYSIWSPIQHFPQEANAYSTKTEKAQKAEFVQCPTSSKNTFSQCFSMACKVGKVVNGVPTADCLCPQNSNIEETTAVPSGAAFFTVAGQFNKNVKDVCTRNPVGGPAPN